jgi:hypothetical protein
MPLLLRRTSVYAQQKVRWAFRILNADLQNSKGYWFFNATNQPKTNKLYTWYIEYPIWI